MTSQVTEQNNFIDRHTQKAPVINETVSRVIDDYSSLLENQVAESYRRFEEIGEKKSFFYINYYAPVLRCEDFNEVVEDTLNESHHMKGFLKGVNRLLKSDDTKSLKEDEPFKQIFRGNICDIPEGSSQESEAIRSAQKAIGDSFVKKIRDLDRNNIYYSTLDKEIGLSSHYKGNGLSR